MDTCKKIKLSDKGEKIFIKNIKIGVFKELHKKNMLTDSQLNQLIMMQK